MAAVGLDTLAAGEDTHSGKRVRPPRLSLSKGGRWEGESVCVRGGGGSQVVDGWLLGSLLLGPLAGALPESRHLVRSDVCQLTRRTKR